MLKYSSCNIIKNVKFSSMGGQIDLKHGNLIMQLYHKGVCFLHRFVIERQRIAYTLSQSFDSITPVKMDARFSVKENLLF